MFSMLPASQRERADFHLRTLMEIANELKPLYGLDAVRADDRGLVVLVRQAVSRARAPWWRRLFGLHWDKRAAAPADPGQERGTP